MAKNPILLVVDDEPDVLQAMELDLRRRYARDYRILKAHNGDIARDTLDTLQQRGEPVALLLADQRMPGLTGVELLEHARRLFPGMKLVLLTAYSDTEVAIRAINQVRLDYYLTKPWHPPEEQLYPVLDDLLSDWSAGYQPAFDGPQIIGSRWSPEVHSLREFLARNMIPFRWLDPETSPDALTLAQNDELPLVLLPDGTRLVHPTPAELGRVSGLRTHAELPFYDLAIVGGGPAGLAAAVYGASEGLRTVLVEKHSPGGQAGTSSRIENYLGFPVGLSGADLARRAVTQARRFGVEILSPLEVEHLSVSDQYRILHLSDGIALNSHAVLIATGVSYRKLDVPGVAELTGAGVYYGATLSEAPLYRDQDVYLVGGANSAGQAAAYFARYAHRVTMLVRSSGLSTSMSRYLVEEIQHTSNIEVLTRTQVICVQGTGHLESITLRSLDQETETTLPAAALFIFIGATPNTDWLGDQVARDRSGYILSGRDIYIDNAPPPTWKLKREPYLLETSLPGVFVAGDVRHRSIKRVASAVGEGAISVQLIHQYLGDF